MPRILHRRQLIIDIAATRFLISGYDLVTVDELCFLSASTKGSFYHFFPNKEALAVDVTNHVWFQVQHNLEAIFSANHPPQIKLGNL
jgi:TetR/AcrR family transcriptional regulator, transcriptional repressor for nem operon